MREIQLSQGKIALVDDADYEMLSAYTWRARPVTKKCENWYAYTSIGLGITYMHRLIMGDIDGVLYDHANGNGLDNQRSNLRQCSGSENSINRQFPNRTGFRGVEVSARQPDLFRARLTVGRKRYRSGWTKDLAEAARRYDQLAIKHHGSFAQLNFDQSGRR